MMQHVLADILKERDFDLGNDDKSKAKIAKHCKIAKHMFNEDSETATVEIEYLTADIEDYELDITLEQFNEICNPIFQKCMNVIGDALQRANYTKEQIDEVILVGGSTRIPEIQRRISEFFGGKELNKTVNPDEAVAVGATIFAGRKQGAEELTDLEFSDVVPLSIGIETLNPELDADSEDGEDVTDQDIPEHIVDPIIRGDTTFPTAVTKKYLTSEPYQMAINFRIFQGESQDSTKCLLVSETMITGLPQQHEQLEVDVTFNIGIDGILQVSAETYSHKGV